MQECLMCKEIREVGYAIRLDSYGNVVFPIKCVTHPSEGV